MKEAKTIHIPEQTDGINEAIETLNKEDLNDGKYFTNVLERMFPKEIFCLTTIPIKIPIDGALNPTIIVYTKRVITEGDTDNYVYQYLKIRIPDGMLLYDPTDNLITIFIKKHKEGIVLKDYIPGDTNYKTKYLNNLSGLIKTLYMFLINI